MTALVCFALTSGCLWAGGFGVGVQTAFDLGGGSAIAPRLEYQRYTDSSTVGGNIDLSATVNSFSLGADYNYFTSGRTDKGFYLLGGLGVATASFNVSASAAGSTSRNSSHQTVLYPEGGVGWQFNRYLGAEVIYKAMSFKDVTVVVAGVPVGYSFSGSLQADLVVRF
jgi:hypothetical protein